MRSSYDSNVRLEAYADVIPTLAEAHEIELDQIGIDVTAARSVPIDLHTVKMLQRAQCETIVPDGGDPENILTAVQASEFEGTRIIPAQKNDPPS